MKTIHKTYQHTNQFFKVICISAVISISLGSVLNSALAEQSDASKQSSNTEAVKKPDDGKGGLPTFAQADKNGDHYVTKDELQNFPYLLQAFDKIDAGHDGKLEQHEYQSLKMETKREGEVK